MDRKQIVQLVNVYSLFPIRVFRFLFGGGLVLLLIVSFGEGHGSFHLLSLSLFFLIWEVFYQVSLAHTKPAGSLSDDATIKTSGSHIAYAAYVLSAGAAQLIRLLSREQGVSFLLQKAGITLDEIRPIAVPLSEVAGYAVQLAQELHGSAVTSADLVVSYLLLSEEQTKLLLGKKLKPGDVLRILFWVRMRYPAEEEQEKVWTPYSGDGLGESLLYGWTPETKKYTLDLTTVAKTRHFPFLGRAQEWQTVVETLAKPHNNNVLLVGEPGVGKEQLVRELAYESEAGRLAARLNHKRVCELLLGPLLAGATDQAELQERLQAIIAEVTHAGNVILYIPELQHILGSSSFKLDLSGALLPYLQDGSISIIASVTSAHFKKYVAHNALRDIFTVVELTEPDENAIMYMLFEKVPEIEKEYTCTIAYTGLVAAMKFATVYAKDTRLPGAAIHLLEDVAAKAETAITDEIVSSFVGTQTHVRVGEPSQAEKQTLLHLEETLKRRVVGQDAALKAISSAVERMRTGLAQAQRPLSFLFLGPTGVGKTETAKALADSYFSGVAHIIRLDMSEYSGPDALKRLLGAAPGEGDERGELTEKLRDNPNTLLLLDEFEKASNEVHNLFLQILAEGRLTDNKGQVTTLFQTLIIATSNAGAEFIRETVTHSGTFTQPDEKALLQKLQEEHVFTPELLNRFDSVIVFHPLTPAQAARVVRLQLDALGKRLDEKDMTLHYTDDVVTAIVRDALDPAYGARPLARYIQDTIETKIAEQELSGVLTRGSLISLTMQNNRVSVA